jgi:hypothetical protein
MRISLPHRAAYPSSLLPSLPLPASAPCPAAAGLSSSISPATPSPPSPPSPASTSTASHPLGSRNGNAWGEDARVDLDRGRPAAAAASAAARSAASCSSASSRWMRERASTALSDGSAEGRGVSD